MEDIKPILAANIAALRTAQGMTQAEFAEKLNYSDKAVSKWERGESLPDITILYQISQLFGVTLDYLVQPEHEAPPVPDLPLPDEADRLRRWRNRVIITSISILAVWMVATLVYVILSVVPYQATLHWLAFVYAVPASAIVWLVFNSIWFQRHRNYLIISILMWSLLCALCATLLPVHVEALPLLLLGIPGQIVILMCSRLRFHPAAEEK